MTTAPFHENAVTNRIADDGNAVRTSCDVTAILMGELYACPCAIYKGGNTLTKGLIRHNNILSIAAYGLYYSGFIAQESR